MNSKKALKRNILMCLMAGSALIYTMPVYAATSVIANTALPSGGNFVAGGKNDGIVQNGLQMDITQNAANAVITWKDFNIGGNAIVNFWGPDNHNTLNYVNGGNMSQIYGTINANNNGNIFIVNPAGVQIGNSAQINVGSLYVSNKYLNEDKLGSFAGAITQEMIDTGKTPDAALMSLGNINANKVTFEGDGRIVIDSERIKDTSGNSKLAAGNIIVNTNAENNLVIGYDAYDETDGYTNVDTTAAVATVNGNNFTKADGYMWVEDINQLQAINTNLGGNYALRNSIDATGTFEWNSNGDSINEGFKQIGTDKGHAFTGKFDGLNYGIFDLNINRDGEDNVGLFGYADGATINNVMLVGGNIIGRDNTGSVVGTAENTNISNIVNAASVSGQANVGGITGSVSNTTINGAINTGKVTGTSQNIGGLVGKMAGSNLHGNSYNLGDISTGGHNVGGIAGYAENSNLGSSEGDMLRNYMNIGGAYNVGGIVGNMTGSTVQNAENSGAVTASSRYLEKYYYHTARNNNNITFGGVQNGLANVNIYVANVGGIAGTSSGSTIKDVTNKGDVSSASALDAANGYSYYTAGNVGGIVGRAENTNISSAVNNENNVRGAHNVGGIAGYFGSTGDTGTRYTISGSENIGGDIMATGARNKFSEETPTGDAIEWHGFVTEQIRNDANVNEDFIIGNIGGIAGYLYGDNVYISGSTNDGTVHSSRPTDPKNVKLSEMAANVGGIAGKIDRSQTVGITDSGLNINGLFGSGTNDRNPVNAAVNSSFNNGDVLGYTGVGGIAGMMYNGELASVYNQGTITSTRQVDNSSDNIDPLNMGGIVGDTTEGTQAQVLLYDVYNEGNIGDAAFVYNGRHVGGVVGRLSGYVEKAYNKGDIYNNDTTVGGIAGWWYKGKINNVFNTGNITARAKTELQVGGIVGSSAQSGQLELSNAYNIGTIRGFQESGNSTIYVAGIIGRVRNGTNTVIKNVYTTGNLYAGKISADGKSYTAVGKNGGLGSIYGTGSASNHIPQLSGANYIQKPDTENFVDLSGMDNINDIAYSDRFDPNEYEGFTFSSQTGGSVANATNDNWRIYDGTTPILNVFLPYSESYFDQYESNDALNDAGIGSVQYGTAYNPTLTIVNAAEGNNKLTFDWQELGIQNLAGLAVYGADLTVNNFVINRGTGHFNGRIYADGDLIVNAGIPNEDGIIASNAGISLGYRSYLYGSSVTVNTNGLLNINGGVIATGSKGEGSGNVNLNAGEVQSYGIINSSAAGGTVTVAGIGTQDTYAGSSDSNEDIANPYAEMISAGSRYGHTTQAATANGDVTVIAETNKNGSGSSGDAGLHFGNKGIGNVTSGGNLNVEAGNDIYIDSDLLVSKDINLVTGSANGEIVLDLSNLGQVRKNAYVDAVEYSIRKLGVDINNPQQIYDNRDDVITAITQTIAYYNPQGTNNDVVAQHIYRLLIGLTENDGIEEAPKASDSQLTELESALASAYMHIFMHTFDKDNANSDSINFAQKVVDANGGVTYQQANDIKLAADMWDYENGAYDFTKYDSMEYVEGQEGLQLHDFKGELDHLNLKNGLPSYANDKQGSAADVYASNIMHIWVSDAAQLQGIQNYAAKTDNGILNYNYALKNDINANWVTGWEAIGTGNANDVDRTFDGTFDGRGNRIIGLDATNGNDTADISNAGIFDTIGTNGTVKNLNIYSSTFTGTTNAGAVAGVNNGTIDNIHALGNRVEVTGSSGNAGGIVGVNNSGTVTAAADAEGNVTYQINGGGINDVESTGSVLGDNGAVAGGLIGSNNGGLLNSYSNSAAVSLSTESVAGLGGVVGVNSSTGTIGLVDSLGITNGGTRGSSNVGGVIGINNGTLNSAYNESIVSGKNNVGGIIGDNDGGANYSGGSWSKGTIENVVNATGVTGTGDYVGGLLGANIGSVTNGRNNGTITGNNYVGGMVGNNADKNSVLTDLVNDSSASISGEEFVGGIAGSNAGTISATDNALINRGSITGNQFVGGVAGENTGIISNTVSNIVLNAHGENAKYFGGVVGQNSGLIDGATNSSDINITAVGGTYVGGIIGANTETGTLKGEIRNEGSVFGKSQVGGIIGQNDNDNVLQGTADDRLKVTNDGTVDAEEGGAAGIFYQNNGDIEYADISNNGVVNGGNKDGGTGGLFGINTGNITESTLTNSGTVVGGGIVGGLIGNNSGDVNNSSLANTGTVIGTNNVGGLIGVNTGTITGGRDNADSYYKYQIYNNGVINAGTWNDKNSNGVIDAGEFIASTKDDNSQNIGGLIGNNKGNLTAGYNTGAINADNSTNVGGIAGSNSAAISQVFNTVMTPDGENQTITGGTNVGGLIGNNSGTLSNAYNTTEVKGNANVGNAVGENSGANAKVDFVYDVTNTDNKLIGVSSNGASVANSYTSAEQEKSADGTEGITYISADKAKDKESYQNFADGTWKFYDGYSNPLLKVFLTNLTVNDSVEIDGKKVTLNEYLKLVYNSGEQDLDIADLIDKGFITAPNEELLEAYKNTLKGDNDLGESYLLDNTNGQVDAGNYNNDEWLYSNQIHSSTEGAFNPNNLGYNIAFEKSDSITVDKATINIDLNDIYHTYGDVNNVYSDKDRNNHASYENSYAINNWNELDKALQDYIKEHLQVGFNNDNAINGDKTQSVGDYDWSLDFTLDGDKASNYQINNSDSVSDVVVTGVDKAHVEKANLTITLDDVECVYGNIDFTNGTGYAIESANLVNGDSGLGLDLSKITDGALIIVNGETRTKDVDNYNWSVSSDASNFTGVDKLGTNYNITVVAGDSKVTPKTITLADFIATVVYGNQDGKGFVLDSNSNLSLVGLVDGDNVTISGDAVYNVIADSDYDKDRNGRDTADVGTYEDSLSVSGITLSGGKAGNYILDTTAVIGNIKVTKANLIINVGNAETVYGDAFNDNDYTHTLIGVTNGDSGTAIDGLLGGNYDNTVPVETSKYTANAGIYEDALGFVNYQQLKNYNVQVENGDIIIDKKQIAINANDEQIMAGETPDYTGTDINSLLANGDSLSGNYNYGVEDSAVESEIGTHADAIGVWIDGVFYGLSQNADWAQAGSFFSNYEINFNPGTLTVSEENYPAVPELPQLPDTPSDWPHNRWDYLFGDNPFDRSENFRERKAEVNFVSGGMEI